MLTLIRRGRIAVQNLWTLLLIRQTITQMILKFKIIFILQLFSVEYIISPIYKTGRKKPFYVNTIVCISLLRNFIIIAIRSRILFHFMKFVVILMIIQICFKLSSLEYKKLTPVFYLKMYSRVFGLQHMVLVWKIIAMVHKLKASKIYKLCW